jgi:opacity protein-like surface antigen
VVFGLEGEAAWSSMVNRFGFINMDASSDRNRWSADLAARTGISAERALIYGKAGVAAGRFDFL